MQLFGSVLIIDDEANLRNTYSRILEKAGCRVSSVSNGSEALRLIANTKFDLVFLDLKLPDMHGIEMLREIRNTDHHLPVIVLTGHGSMTSAVEALHLEATDYLLKPIDPEILVSRTTSVLMQQKNERRKRVIQEQIAQLQAELAELDLMPLPSGQIIIQSNIPFDTHRYINAGPFTLDLQTRRVSVGPTILEIPPSSFEYLVVLAKHAPQVVRYQDLVNEAQGYKVDYTEAKNLSRWHIHVLRQVIEVDSKSPTLLLNVRGVGYQFVTD
jgi:DNA-binding response OmpR family regulator